MPAFKLAVKKLTEPAKVSKRKKKKETDTQSFAEIESETASSADQSLKNKLHIPGLITAAACSAVFVSFLGVSIYNINTNPKGIDGPNRGYVAMSAVDECIAAGDEAFDRNDYIIASVYYDYAKTLVAAWQGYLYDSDLLEEALEAKVLEAVKIPDSVTELGKQAFFNCTSLKEVTLGAGIKEIPDSAFDECTALTSIVIPEGVERIGEYAFDGSLKTVTLPKSLTYVDRSGFIFGNLEKVVYNGTEEEFEQIESYDDEIRFIQCPIEYADGTIGGTDISQNSGSSDGEKSGTVLFVAITVIVILVLVSASAFFIARRNKQAKQK